MNGMPQRPNQPQGPFTDDSNWGQLPQPQQPQQPNNWAQLLGQLAHAYAKKQQAMAPPTQPAQTPSAPPADIPLPPARGNAWNKVEDNQRAPSHPMYDVRSQMDQQMAELKKTTDKYFADRQAVDKSFSFGQQPAAPDAVGAANLGVSPQAQAAPPAQAPQSQPSGGGQPQQQSSQPSYQSGGGSRDEVPPPPRERSWKETVSDPETYKGVRTPKTKKDEKKNKGDSKAKDKGKTADLSTYNKMTERIKSGGSPKRELPGFNKTRQAIEVNEPNGWSAGELLDPTDVIKSVGGRIRDMGRGSVRDPGLDVGGLINDLGALSAGSPQDTRVGKAFQAGQDKFNQFRDAYQGNPDAVRESLMDVGEGSLGVAAGRGLQGKLGRGPAKPSLATPKPPSSTTGSKPKIANDPPSPSTPKPVVDRKKFIPPGKLSNSIKSIKPDAVVKGAKYDNPPANPKAKPNPMKMSEETKAEVKAKRVEPAGKPAPKSTRTKKKVK